MEMFCTFPKVTLRECGQLAIRKDKNKNIDIKSIDQNWNLEMTGLCWIMFQVRVWNNIGRLEICLNFEAALIMDFLESECLQVLYANWIQSLVNEFLYIIYDLYFWKGIMLAI